MSSIEQTNNNLADHFPQFPSGDAEITIRAHYSSIGRYNVKTTTQMGWSLCYVNRWNNGDNVKVAKSCNGAISCTNEVCTLRKNVQLVPISTKLKTDDWCEKSSGQTCHAPLTHIQCSYVAIFTFSGDTCRLTPGHKEGQNVHTHDLFVPKKLSPQQADKLHGMVKNGATPSELQMGMSKRTNNLGNASEIHPDFENIEKLQYERKKILKASPIEQPKMNSLIKDFFKIQEEFPGYITLLWLTKGEMVISFCPPKLKKVLKIHKYPFITDVTFSVFESGYYLCTSVMYCEVLQSHPIVFGAVLDGVTAKHFDFYYQVLFNAYEIVVFPQDPDEENGKNILGFLQDFSQAQHKGFISAYKWQTKNSKEEGLKYHHRKPLGHLGHLGNRILSQRRDSLLW
ncbi:hypothetical protein INT45_009250 [Circinella minor]|uniref:Uncharacterized protein n=1 Tax=Circinella minor TaxID=1195481 RepID=A0A8H7RS90_9FUNG|nr:hypothetical protein INT45_009250 [Circinella minor]